ncbi:MAG: peptide chain release factor 1 [Oscillospiraceae bacterium]|nr:peptide chain release factor 1 [Oscillospiraceae bacterium]
MNTDKLTQLLQRYEEILQRMQEPETWQNPELVSGLQKEAQELQPIAETVRDRQETLRRLQEAEEMLSDPELRELAADEKKELQQQLGLLEERIQTLLLPKDPDDGRDVILEIRGGVGGEEGALFAADLYRMYSMYAESRGWKMELVTASETELGGLKEVICMVEGRDVYSRLKFEGGGHRVQRVPVTESGGRIHTSAATVAVLPQVEETDFRLNMNELRIDTFRSSGAGGQHINKTESAIRVTHLPTGLVVECQDERSQYKNKDRALAIMRSKLYEREQQEKHEAQAAERKNQVGSGDRSDRIRTYNFPQNRVTDHRLSGEGRSFNLESIINGNLDPLLDALIQADQTERLYENTDSDI